MLILSTVWWPVVTYAQDPAIEAMQQNIAVAYQPPQSSAEALLSLPTVYVLPGSFLYWCKHTIEGIQLWLAADDQARSELLLEFSRRRLAEGYQAVRDSDWAAAKQALQAYQGSQGQLSQGLESLQQHNTDVTKLLKLLDTQLGVQHALEQYVGTQDGTEAKEVGALLKIRPGQTSALAKAENGALLGTYDRKQATTSANQASVSASPSAQPHISLPAGGY